jgi:hypothetical protein
MHAQTKTEFAVHSRKIAEAKKAAKLAEKVGVSNAILEQKKHTVQELQQNRRRFCDFSYLGHLNQLRKAAKKLKDAIKSLNQEKRRIPCGAAECVFN